MNTPALLPTTVKLEPSLKERVQRLALARDRSSHWMLHEAVAQFVEREEKRETFRQAATAAWDEYRVTGQHVTAAEADVWMAKLEAGEDLDPPAWHS